MHSLGDHHSAKLIIASVDFQEIVEAIFANRWDDVLAIMYHAAMQLQTAGADIIAICSNTLHKVYPTLVNKLDVPVFHILEEVINYINHKQIKQLAIIGTIFTMTEDFHASYLEKFSQANIIYPNKEDMDFINEFIFNGLCKSRWSHVDVQKIKGIIKRITQQHDLTYTLLGCTEFSYFFEKEKISEYIIDTVALHSQALSTIALGKNFNVSVDEVKA